MSQKPETTFYQSVHKHLPSKIDREKMHNPYSGGTWDVWYDGKKDLWVEYKFIVLPKRPTTMIDPELSELQKRWGRKRYEHGRQVAVIVGCKEGGVIFQNLEWEQPISAAEFRKRLLTRQELANWVVQHTGIP